jgi:hypothetical protein
MQLVTQTAEFVPPPLAVAEPFAWGTPTVIVTFGALFVMQVTSVGRMVPTCVVPGSLPFPAQLHTSACAATAKLKIAQMTKNNAREETVQLRGLRHAINILPIGYFSLFRTSWPAGRTSAPLCGAAITGIFSPSAT